MKRQCVYVVIESSFARLNDGRAGAGDELIVLSFASIQPVE